MSIVYILTNELMPEVIKIGKTGNVEKRIKELDSTAIPLPFECFYAVKVGNDETALQIEKNMHRGLDSSRVHSKREFFRTSPEHAKSLLKIAETMGGINVTPNTEDTIEDNDDRQALKEEKSRRVNFQFEMLGIEAGETLTFRKDDSITCQVQENNKVLFEGEILSLSESARIILKNMGYSSEGSCGH